MENDHHYERNQKNLYNQKKKENILFSVRFRIFKPNHNDLTCVQKYQKYL